MNDQEVEEMEDEDIDLHYIKSIPLNPGSISIENKKFVMDSMIRGDRVFFDGLTTINRSSFSIIFFSRLASDYYIEKYLSDELGYDPGVAKNLLNNEDKNCQIFLNRFANIPDYILTNAARKSVLDRLKKEILKNFQVTEINNLMKPFEKMTTEELVTFYQMKYLK